MDLSLSRGWGLSVALSKFLAGVQKRLQGWACLPESIR